MRVSWFAPLAAFCNGKVGIATSPSVFSYSVSRQCSRCEPGNYTEERDAVMLNTSRVSITARGGLSSKNRKSLSVSAEAFCIAGMPCALYGRRF